MKKMKKVSAKLFFCVLWSGVCQALGWFFGLFGYKREGKFAKWVWRLFALSAAVIMGIIAITLVISTCQEYYWKYRSSDLVCEAPNCYANERVYRDIYFHNHEDGKGFVYNITTGEKMLKNVAWIAKPIGKDSLVCFSDGKKQGYFSKSTGRVVLEPKYDHAWRFSDGLASVEENGYVKFIDGTGKVVIDKQMAYVHNIENYVFQRGYCVINADDDELCGLMDRTGRVVLPIEYSSIMPTNDFKFWKVWKGEESGVFDSEMKTIIPVTRCSIYIGEGTIDVTMPDHTMRKYNLSGELINDFYISDIRTLEYEKNELFYRTKTHDDDGNAYAEPIVESYHPQACARLMAYVAGDNYEGLMTKDGHRVTMPLYKDINAIGPDVYLCTCTNRDKVILNGSGKIVK